MECHAAVYCRISDDREGAGLGVARQEADCRQRAAALGWTVVGLYVDNDLSAYAGKVRLAHRPAAPLPARVSIGLTVRETKRTARSHLCAWS